MAAPSRRFRKRFLLLLIPLGILGVFFWKIAVIPPEPVYKNRPLSSWLRPEVKMLRGMKYISSGPKLSAADLRAIGPSAVHWLAYTAEHGRRPDKPRPPRGTFASWIRELRGWSDRLFRIERDNYNERQEALYCLNKLGPDAAPAIPTLVRILQNDTDDYGVTAANALIQSGPAAQGDVLRLFLKGPRTVRVCLIMNLPHYGAEPAENLEYLLASCRDPDPELRLTAFYSLKGYCIRNHFNADTDRVAPFAIDFLSNPQVPVYERIEFLARFGERAAPAIPRLLELLDDPEATTRNSAAFALTRADPKGLTIAPQMRDFLKSGNPARQEIARRILILCQLEESPAN